MARKYPQFQNSHDPRRISSETDPVFLCTLQQALLLALEEKGYISRVQFQQVENALMRQRH